MKKYFVLAFVLFCSALYAYNPAVGGEDLSTISGPLELTSASSAAGGGMQYIAPVSISFNPALAAMERRVAISASFSAIAQNRFNQAFALGFIAPTRYAAFSLYSQGYFMPSSEESNYAPNNAFGVKFGVSKEVYDFLSLGMNVSGGCTWKGSSYDFSFSADIGALARFEKVSFLRDVRLGVSVLNLGKTFKNQELPTLDGSGKSGFFPGIATIKLAGAATFLQTEYVDIGATVGLSFPSFANIVVDSGITFSIIDMIYISISESINVQEAVKKHYNFMPAIGVGCKINFSTGKSEFVKKRNWEKSEMLISGGWQRRYSKTDIVTAGVLVKLGMADKTPPKIGLWGEESAVENQTEEATEAEASKAETEIKSEEKTPATGETE